jgi:hypothetical protein
MRSGTYVVVERLLGETIHRLVNFDFRPALCLIPVVALCSLMASFLAAQYLLVAGALTTTGTLLVLTLRHRIVACTPFLILAPTLFFEYGLRPAYLLSEGKWGWNAHTFTPITQFNINDFIGAQLLGLLGIVAMSAPILILAQRNHTQPFSLNVIVGGLGPFAALSMGLIISIVGVSLTGAGFGNTSELAVRDFAGSGYLYALNYGAIAGVLCFLLLIRAGHLSQRRYQVVAFGATMLAVGIYAGFLGGRSEPITLIIAAVVIFALRSNGISRHLLVAGAMALVVLSVSYRVAVREVFFQENKGVSTSQLLEKSVDSPLSALIGGQDISAFDKLIALRSEWESKPLLGSTILATGVRWIPSETSFARMEGGNEIFTSTLYPERYRAGTGLDGVSILGEGYINFGTAGVVLVALGVGLFIAVLHRRAYDGPLSMAAYALALARIPGMIRGDMLHATIGFALPLFWVFVILSLVAYSSSRSQQVSKALLVPAQ